MVPLVNKMSEVEIQTCHENSSSYKPLMQNKFAFTEYTKRKPVKSYYEYSSFYKPTTQNNNYFTLARF